MPCRDGIQVGDSLAIAETWGTCGGCRSPRRIGPHVLLTVERLVSDNGRDVGHVVVYQAAPLRVHACTRLSIAASPIVSL